MTPEHHKLPNGLLIILHLHLLNFPLRDAAGYDERLFDATSRGMGQRSKALEDIAFFLVGKIEGTRERTRSVSGVQDAFAPRWSRCS